MLEKKYRLKKNKEFSYVFNKGEKFFTKFISIFFVKTKKSPFKLGFSINSKIGNSVVRHKLKRQLSHIFKNYIPLLKENFNYVILARPGIEKLSFLEISENVKYMLTKANLLKWAY